VASKDIVVPDLGDFKDVAVIDVLVKPGDSVQVDSPLLTLETEKATMDVPSTDVGVIEAVHVAKGGRVSTGTRIATLRLSSQDKGSAAASPDKPATATASPPAAAKRATPVPEPAAASAAPAPVTAAPAPRRMPPIDERSFASAHAGPSVRRFARELGVDLGRVKGSGLKGRITDADVKAFVKSVMAGGASAAASAVTGGGLPRVKVPDFADYGAVEVRPLGRVQRISGARLHASWVNLPHVTQFDEADISELEELRKSLKDKAGSSGIKLTTLAFVVRACVKTLQHYPLFNSSLDASGENLVYKKYIHIGFAADTPNGLLVPVIRDADRKDIYEIARALADLSAKARNGKLTGAEMQGGSFTISSLGGVGGTAFTPIINAPEVAILGVSRTAIRPLFQNGSFVPRIMLPLSLSYDHRVIDGANGARFTTHLCKLLADGHALAEAVP
jgi:pyruvate dehydrogenase E2 component (dihydrolipoamide acetyltransferase)